MKKISLVNLAKDEMKNRELVKLKGGAPVTCDCSGGGLHNNVYNEQPGFIACGCYDGADYDTTLNMGR